MTWKRSLGRSRSKRSRWTSCSLLTNTYRRCHCSCMMTIGVSWSHRMGEVLGCQQTEGLKRVTQGKVASSLTIRGLRLESSWTHRNLKKRSMIRLFLCIKKLKVNSGIIRSLRKTKTILTMRNCQGNLSNSISRKSSHHQNLKNLYRLSERCLCKDIGDL